MNSNLRTGITWIVAATAIFAVALACFCIALGLDFKSEGWQSSGGFEDGNAEAVWSRPLVIGSTIAFLLSIVIFFVGVQRVSQSSSVD